MKVIAALFAVLCVGGSGTDLNYDSSEFMDEGLPQIAHEVWRGQGVVRKQLFFLQMYAEQLIGPMRESFPVSIAIAIVAILLAASLSIKDSHSLNWWYKDAEGVVHGPFSTLCMSHWRSTGYLPDDLEIKYAANASFAPLRELFPAPAVPFQSPPTPPGTQSAPPNYQVEVFEEEVSADMLRDQREAFESRAQDLEVEMIMTLEADLEDSVLSDDVGQQKFNNRKDNEACNSFFKPYDEEELAEIRAWRAQRQLHRKELAESQIQTSRYNPEKTLNRGFSKGKENAMKRNSSEERIQKQFNTWCCNEIVSEHEAQLDESLASLIESK